MLLYIHAQSLVPIFQSSTCRSVGAYAHHHHPFLQVLFASAGLASGAFDHHTSYRYVIICAVECRGPKVRHIIFLLSWRVWIWILGRISPTRRTHLHARVHTCTRSFFAQQRTAFERGDLQQENAFLQILERKADSPATRSTRVDCRIQEAHCFLLHPMNPSSCGVSALLLTTVRHRLEIE